MHQENGKILRTRSGKIVGLQCLGDPLYCGPQNAVVSHPRNCYVLSLRGKALWEVQ